MGGAGVGVGAAIEEGLIVVPLLATPDSVSSSSSSKPNFVHILIDDLSWNSMGYMGYDLSFATPFMDSMAQNDGVIFTSHYTQSVCTPARAALMTGRYPLHTGMQYEMVEPTIEWGLQLKEQLLPEVLRDAGYKTHMVGKWHLGHHSTEYLPTARGFDTFLGYLLGESHYFSHNFPHPIASTMYYDMIESNRTHYVPRTEYKGTYSGTVFFDRAKALATAHVNGDDSDAPLYLYIALQNVHAPLDDMPDAWFTDGDRKSLATVSGSLRHGYARSLMKVDKMVEDLYTHMEALGIANNTYFIVHSDNGGCYLGGGRAGPLRGGKATLFEGGTKVPAFIASKLLSDDVKGLVYDEITHITDFMPTILSLAGVNVTSLDHELDGIDLTPVLDGTTTEALRTVMLYNIEHNVEGVTLDTSTNASLAIRVGDYKLIHERYAGWYGADEELSDDDDMKLKDCQGNSTGEYIRAVYNLKDDPFETVNLYDSVGDKVLTMLYAHLTSMQNKASVSTRVVAVDDEALATATWNKAGGVIVPYVLGGCGMYTMEKSCL